MHKLSAVLLTLATFITPALAADTEAGSLRQRALKSAKQAVGLIDRTSATFLETRKCFTCHTQTFAALVLTHAARAGIDINEVNLEAQVERAYEIYDSLGGVRPDTVGHALLALDIGNRLPNDKTEAMLKYLLDYGERNRPWKVAIEDREPAEASDFTTNYLAIRAANRYGTTELKTEIEARRRAVSFWVTTAKANHTEDQVFRLLLAHELKIAEKHRLTFVQRLLDEQHVGGGWSQKAGMAPDAYATASALVALNKAGNISVGHEKWKAGIRYLFKTQQPDGSWHVTSRAKPVQEYFESGFPHGKDQFISAFATGWATEALLILVLPEEP